ncbi:peptidase M20 domain-containing protein 2 [Ixodes scapularis]|uniref:peptidase M20 domain-containing protein 2 n=1 Tax=Ixodes scapularis TaxID=6945 RepID=UPI001C3942FA|nr:peptidase M20 domain-containing protein 2 [Ixodes scapularis]
MAHYMKIVSDIVDDKADSLNELGRYLWNNPETALKEFKAHKRISDFLECEGFTVQKNYILPTAFRAEFGGKGPVVVFMCEYDALPEIGHACGHNLIAECAVAAGIGVMQVLQENSSLTGKVVVLGTPAEEAQQGKVDLLRGGAFDDADIALMAHPSRTNSAYASTYALLQIGVEYEGRPSHAGIKPWDGVNALDAAVGAYVNVGLLRQQMKPDMRISGIITDGGKLANILPAESKMEFVIRAPENHELKSLRTKLERCLRSSAEATGCSIAIRDQSPLIEALNQNRTMGKIYQEYAQKFGIDFSEPGNETKIAASTDAGNVSNVIPVLHPGYKLEDATTSNHTPEFANAAVTPKSFDATLKVAKALALTALEVLSSPDLLNNVRMEFDASIAASGIKTDPNL